VLLWLWHVLLALVVLAFCSDMLLADRLDLDLARACMYCMNELLQNMFILFCIHICSDNVIIHPSDARSACDY